MTQYELYHHGILGQKWGRKQGPPYPLDPEDHSAAERKAGYRKSLGGGRNPESYRSKKAAIKKARRDRDRAIQDRYDREERRIESKYKKGQNLSEKDANRLAKASERAQADWYKSNIKYKQDRLDLSFQKQLDLNAKADAWTNSGREKYREKIQAKYDKKIASAKNPIDEYTLKGKRDAKLKDFDEGSIVIKKGQERYAKTIEKYRDANLKALENVAYKNDPKYKEAVRNYVNQMAYDSLNYGSNVTKLHYASEYAREYIANKK